MLDKSVIKRISIFDFDGTLVKTPVKPKNWMGGWWGRKESLLPPWMPHAHELKDHMHLLDSKVYSEYQKAVLDPEALAVLMTGRHQGISWLVLKILEGFGIDPQGTPKQRAIFISGGGGAGGSRTLDLKVSHIINMIAEFPNVNEVEMWEDRPEHVIAFRDFGKTLQGVTLWVHEPPEWD